VRERKRVREVVARSKFREGFEYSDGSNKVCVCERERAREGVCERGRVRQNARERWCVREREYVGERV